MAQEIKDIAVTKTVSTIQDTDFFEGQNAAGGVGSTFKIAKADLVPTASESQAGILEIADQSETNTGSDDARAVTPKKLNNHPAITLFMYNNFI